jgi:hypothetical protein
MRSSIFTKSFIFLSLLAAGMIAPQRLYAHQQPTTLISLDISPNKVVAQLETPLSELEIAFG